MQPKPLRSLIPTIAPKAWRIRFVADSDDLVGVIRRFAEVKPMAAISAAIDPAALPKTPALPEPVDQLDVLVIAPGSAARVVGEDWLAPPDDPNAPQSLSIPFEKGKLSWRPGRVLVEKSTGVSDENLAAIAEFAFYESELRKMEAAVAPYEESAAADAADAYDVRRSAGERREKFHRVMEHLARMRLQFARLEPHLYVPDRSLPAGPRHLIGRLARRAAVDERLEALSDRLEACEDLYEGGVDRINDYRLYRKGHLLEIAIVVLLAIEVLQLSADMIIRLALQLHK